VPTSTIPARLTLTLEQIRDRLVAQIGVRGIPNPWATHGEDCLAFLLWGAGVRKRDDYWNPLVSIGGFRAVSGWHEVDADELRPGDFVLWSWNGDDEADHVEFCYSRDKAAGTITTISANTGQRVGDDIEKHPELRGVWKKTRPLDGRVVGGIRPPYAAAATGVTPSDRANVRLVAAYANRAVPATYEGRTFYRSEAGTIPGAPSANDGIRGTLYWLLVQLWGRLHGLYGRAFKIDGIPGPQSRRVEAELLRVAKLSKSKLGKAA
jgi:hypothetical protein